MGDGVNDLVMMVELVLGVVCYGKLLVNEKVDVVICIGSLYSFLYFLDK